MNVVGLFLYYISNLGSLSSISDLQLLEWYHIFPSLNPELYHTNYFLYVLSQYEVSIDIITTLSSHIADIYIKTKDIGFLDKLVKLGFIICKAQYRKSCEGKYRLDKLSHKKDNYIIGYKFCWKPISLLIFIYH